MNAVQLRIEIREKRASLVSGWHSKAMKRDKIAQLTAFQQYRRGRALLVAGRYFGSKSGIEEIAKIMGMTHQRVSAILGDAVAILEADGLIDRGSGVHRTASKRRNGKENNETFTRTKAT